MSDEGALSYYSYLINLCLRDFPLILHKIRDSTDVRSDSNLYWSMGKPILLHVTTYIG